MRLLLQVAVRGRNLLTFNRSLPLKITQTRRINMTSVEDITHEPSALIPVADGSEEIEATTLADVLVRGGVKVTVASVGQKEENIVKMSRGLKIQADLAIEACVDLDFDLIVLPGGMPGATHLRDCQVLTELLKKQQHENKWYGAICAAPAVVLHHHKLLNDAATCYPGMEKDMAKDVAYQSENVVVSGKCITSRGPGTAMEMGVKLVELLRGRDVAVKVANGLLMSVP